MKFEQLYKTLNLDQEGSIEDKLQTLRHWCEQHISRDIQYTGSLEESYEKYRQLAKYFLDEVMPAIPEDKGQPKDAFDGYNTIQFVAAAGMDRLLHSLAPDKALVNQPDQYGMTPLHMAAVHGYYHTVKTLWDLGASVESLNNNQQMPIFSSLFLPISHEDDLQQRKIKIFRFLQDKSPDTLENRDKSGDSVLQLIALHGYVDLIEEVLQKKPMLLNIRNNHTHYPVHTAILNAQSECLAAFLKMEGVPEQADASGEVALHYAARYGEEAMAALCCEAYDNVDPVDERERTPLMLAAKSANLPAIRVLMAKGADTARQDLGGSNILHYAAISGDRETVEWVLGNTGVNIDSMNYDKQTAVNISERYRQTAIRELLLKHGASESSSFSS